MWQSKTFNAIDKCRSKLLETEFTIAICSPIGDKWQSKTLFLVMCELRSSLVKSVFNCCLSGVFKAWPHLLRHFKTMKVSNGAKIRNRYNQVPHLTQDTNGKVTNSQKTPQTRAKRSALSQQVTKKHI